MDTVHSRKQLIIILSWELKPTVVFCLVNEVDLEAEEIVKTEPKVDKNPKVVLIQKMHDCDICRKQFIN